MIRHLPVFLASLALCACSVAPATISAQKAATLNNAQLIAACGPRNEWQLKKTREMREPAVAEAVRRRLIRKSMAADILEGYAVIGMTENEARASWGAPRDINSTYSTHYDQEQWCYGEYGGSYLYFSGGRLRTIQN